jgi:hypothetical protein
MQFNLEDFNKKVKFTFKQKYHEIPKKGMLYLFLGTKKYKGVSYYYGGDLKNLKRTKRIFGKKEKERLKRFSEFKETKEDYNNENLEHLNIEPNDDECEIKFKRKLKKKKIVKSNYDICGENFESDFEPFEYLIFDDGDISKQYFNPPLINKVDTFDNFNNIGFQNYYLMNKNYFKNIEKDIIEKKLKKGIIKNPTIENDLHCFSKKYGIFLEFVCYYGCDSETDIFFDNICMFVYSIEDLKFEDGKIDIGF